ncbi:hypothetical protein [Deinococcus saxicola]|uniref:hypothetical protein n=1 Tax=Deinococcus saxicola TaxID=249406 RepID=UPI0039EFEA3C
MSELKERYTSLKKRQIVDFRYGFTFFGDVLADFHGMAHESMTRHHRGFDPTGLSGTAPQTLCAVKSFDIAGANPIGFHFDGDVIESSTRHFHFFQALIVVGIDDDRLHGLGQI